MKESILIIEDDKTLQNYVAYVLEACGYEIFRADNGIDGLMEAAARRPTVFVLALELPDLGGLAIIRKLRAWTTHPIIAISTRDEAANKVTVLDEGADDYLVKPFNLEELAARIRAAIRQMGYGENRHKSEQFFINGGLRIDYVAGCVYVNDVETHLTPMEYKLLCLLAQNMGKILTHGHILKEIWSSDLDSDTQSLRVFMAALRKKIEQNPAEPLYLQTHVGIGYRMIQLPGAVQATDQQELPRENTMVGRRVGRHRTSAPLNPEL